MKAYIFDLDGTLLDSMGLWEQIDRVMLAKRGIPFPENYAEHVEIITPLSPHETAAYVIQHFGLKETVEEVMHEWDQIAVKAYGSSLPLKPYSKEFLHSLKAQGAKMAIATSSPANLCTPALRRHGILDLFDAVCLSEEVGCGKNKPDIFLLAAERLGELPQNCIVYEDSLTAIKTAKSIGMTVCAVYDPASDNTWDEIKQIADYIIHDFAALTVPHENNSRQGAQAGCVL